MKCSRPKWSICRYCNNRQLVLQDAVGNSPAIVPGPITDEPLPGIIEQIQTRLSGRLPVWASGFGTTV